MMIMYICVRNSPLLLLLLFIYLFIFWEGRRPSPFAMSHLVGREDKRTNNRIMFPTLKLNAAAGY